MADPAFADDRSIPDESHLFRRIPPDQVVLNAQGARAVSTGLFRSSGGSLSVGLEVLLDELGHEPSIMLSSYPEHGLTQISCGLARQPDPASPQKRLGVTKERDHEEPPWHGSLTGKITKSLSSKLAEASTKSVLQWPSATSAEP